MLDFGISKVTSPNAGLTHLTRGDVMLGSPYYMSPEQADQRAAEADARTDIYALATVAYEMFTGKPPFSAPSLARLLDKILRERAPLLSEQRPDLPPELSEALDRAMAKNPTDRFANITAFDEAVQARDLR